MNSADIPAMLEAMLFASGEPVGVPQLAQEACIPETAVSDGLEALGKRLDEAGSGIRLLCLEGRYQLATRPAYTASVGALLQTRRSAPLTQAALEVLAILAYHQPVSRGYIEQVRGTDSSSTVASLVAKGLVEEAGRLDLPGRPIVFRTTDAFLRCFGLTSLDELGPAPAARAASAEAVPDGPPAQPPALNQD